MKNKNGQVLVTPGRTRSAHSWESNKRRRSFFAIRERSRGTLTIRVCLWQSDEWHPIIT
jgi:hypothetical protein